MPHTPCQNAQTVTHRHKARSYHARACPGAACAIWTGTSHSKGQIHVRHRLMYTGSLDHLSESLPYQLFLFPSQQLNTWKLKLIMKNVFFGFIFSVLHVPVIPHIAR